MKCPVLIGLAVLFTPSVLVAEPFQFPQAASGTGKLSYVNGVPVLVVEGTPEQIGAAVGGLAVAPAGAMASYPDDMLKHYGCGFLRPLFIRLGNRMIQHFPEDYRRELEAVAKSSGVDRDCLVLGNTLFDLKKMLACSALLVEPGRSATGGPLLARNLDYPSLGYAHEYSLVTVYRPVGKHAFVSIGFPGLLGCLSGMNDSGLAVAILEVFQVKAGHKKLDRQGLPYALCYRRLLEECSTIAEAKQLLESLHRTTTTNLVLADRHGVTVFEVSPEHVIVRPASQGTCVCTNHYSSARLKPLVPINVAHSFERHRILSAACQSQEQFGLADLQRSLHAASDPHATLQTMVFEPVKLRLHVAIGTCPSSAAEMKTLDLAPWLKP